MGASHSALEVDPRTLGFLFESLVLRDVRVYTQPHDGTAMHYRSKDGTAEIDIVVELIGGYTVAKELVLKAIENGKHVVTANKALIAVHGNEIFAKAREKGVIVAFEAAVAGGIPVIKAIREGLERLDARLDEEA